MALERFIRNRILKLDGKRHNHDGRRANIRGIDSARQQVKDYYMPEGEGTEIELFVSKKE